MSGEKLTDEEVLAAHKIVPLCGEPRSSPTLPSLSYLPCLLLVPCLPCSGKMEWLGVGGVALPSSQVVGTRRG